MQQSRYEDLPAKEEFWGFPILLQQKQEYRIYIKKTFWIHLWQPSDKYVRIG